MVDVGAKMTHFSSNLMIDDVSMLKWSPKTSLQNLSLISQRKLGYRGSSLTIRSDVVLSHLTSL